MSWLFSQVLVEEYLGDTCSDGEQSVPLNGKPTQQAYCLPDKMTDYSRLSRFGMMFKPLTESRGKELLVSYQAVFRAKTLVQQEQGGVLLEAVVQCGNTWQGLLAKYNPSTHSLKTAQCSLVEDLNPSCVTLPKWGSMLNGAVFQRQISVQTMKEREFGSLLPTPTCHNSKEGAYPAEYTRKTPTLATHIGGKIHPMFTEWMMGWPLGWTDLKPLETDKYRKWRQLHGNY
jgi:hypothetical protein